MSSHKALRGMHNNTPFSMVNSSLVPKKWHAMRGTSWIFSGQPFNVNLYMVLWIGSLSTAPLTMFNLSGVKYRWVPLKPDFWEHENQSGLLVIWLIYIKLYRKKEKQIWGKIQAKRESGLTTVWLKWDPPVYVLYV